MPRYKLTIEYDGAGFAGWQRQEGLPTVQGCLEQALSPLAGGTELLVQCSGRTDAGVHAFGQVAHVDLPKHFPADVLFRAVNFHLQTAVPEGSAISVLHVEQATDDFHARFDARQRFYQYRIINRPAPVAVDRFHYWHIRRPLGTDSMQAAANLLLGQHDFTSFRASECQAKDPVKTLDQLTVTRQGERIIIDVSARSFLHHQVRNLVGTLKLVGQGDLVPEDMQRILDARNRSAAGPTAPAHGLYLVRIEY